MESLLKGQKMPTQSSAAGFSTPAHETVMFANAVVGELGVAEMVAPAEASWL